MLCLHEIMSLVPMLGRNESIFHTPCQVNVEICGRIEFLCIRDMRKIGLNEEALADYAGWLKASLNIKALWKSRSLDVVHCRFPRRKFISRLSFSS